MQLQKSLEQYQEIPKSVVGSYEQANFWGCEEFARILPNLPEKKQRPPKKALLVLLGAIFAHIFKDFLRFSGIL